MNRPQAHNIHHIFRRFFAPAAPFASLLGVAIAFAAGALEHQEH
jgi:hypothetical protein